MGIQGIWTDLETHVGFWCCCFPAVSSIPPLIAKKLSLCSTAKSQKTPSSVQTHGTRVPGPSARDSGWRSKTSKTNGYVMSGTGVDRDSDSQEAGMPCSDATELDDFRPGRVHR